MIAERVKRMKIWVRILCGFLCVLLLGGCAAPIFGEDSSPESGSLTVSDAESTQAIAGDFSSSYGEPICFEDLVSVNQIDKAYETAMQIADEPFETIAVTYLDAWKEEFRLSKEHISEFVDEKQSQELMDDLTSWETIVMDNYQWTIVNVHNDSKFSSPFGSQGYVEEYVHLAQEYRYKTLWLKRIFFMKELEKRFDEEQPSPTVKWYSLL